MSQYSGNAGVFAGTCGACGRSLRASLTSAQNGGNTNGIHFKCPCGKHTWLRFECQQAGAGGGMTIADGGEQ
jgi:hypothetical protein